MKEKLLNAKDRIVLEIWNAITHGIGVVLGVVFLVMLILRSIDQKSVTALVAYCVYGACFILMFLMSTLYHAIQHKKAKSVLRIFDHISIYYFIAGSYTPPILLLTSGWKRVVFWWSCGRWPSLAPFIRWPLKIRWISTRGFPRFSISAWAGWPC